MSRSRTAMAFGLLTAWAGCYTFGESCSEPGSSPEGHEKWELRWVISSPGGAALAAFNVGTRSGNCRYYG